MRLRLLAPLACLMVVIILLCFTNLTSLYSLAETQAEHTPYEVDTLTSGDTFSIVAYDPETGEIGSAGTSCVGRTIDFLGDLIVDSNGTILGGINTQAAYLSGNQTVARNRMLAGDSPQDIVDFMAANDVEGNSGGRQYGVVGFDNSGNLATAGFTGNTTGDYHGHITGVNYAIQGNILVNADVLADMETAFNAEKGSLSDKLMAALQGAKRVGGDIRCQGSGNSGRASFIKVLKPGDTTPYIDITLGPVNNGIEPIDELQCQYDALQNASSCNNTITSFPYVMNFEDFSWRKPEANCGVNTASWIRTQFSTASTNTGPTAANEGSLYAFVESSDLGNGFSNTAIMESPCFTFPENHTISFQFDYHMFGANMGELSLQVFSENVWQTVWTRSGDLGGNWINNETVNLSNYSGNTVKIRFAGLPGNGFRSDMAVDDILIDVEDASQNFIFDNGSWSPNTPNLAGNTSDKFDTITVLSGSPTLTEDVVIGNITIASGASLTLNGSALSVSGDIENLGALNANQGRLNFIGDAPQRVSGNPIAVQNVQFNQTGIVTLDTAFEINGVMQLNAGTLKTNDNLVFTDYYDAATDSHTTGVFDTYSGGSIMGNVRTERYIPARRAFRFISSSVSTGTGTIRQNWQENGNTTPNLGTHITGANGAANGFDETATNNPSLFKLDVPSQSYTPIANTNNTALNAGDAYLMLFRGDRTVDLSTNTPKPTPTVLRTSGALHIGSYNIPQLSNVANGSTLIGNPYQAPVDMGKVLENSTNINTRYYHVWDPFLSTRGAFVTVDTQTNSNSLTYGGVALSPANKFLQPHQSAFINTISSGAASLQFKETDKDVSGNGVGIFRPNEEETSINVLLYDNDNTLLDGTKVIFSKADNNAFTVDDALKVDNIDESLATLVDDEALSIQRRSLPQDQEIIPIQHKSLDNVSHKLKVSVINLPEGLDAHIVDRYLNKNTLLSNDKLTEIDFTLNHNDAESRDPNRFSLVFKEKVLSLNDYQLKPTIAWLYNKTLNEVTLSFPRAIDVEQLNLYDIQGRRVLVENIGTIITNRAIDVSTLSSGVYILGIQTTNTSKQIYKTLKF